MMRVRAHYVCISAVTLQPAVDKNESMALRNNEGVNAFKMIISSVQLKQFWFKSSLLRLLAYNILIIIIGNEKKK